MDDLGDFFDFSKPFQRKIVFSGSVNGNVQVEKKFTNEIVKREKINNDYANVYVEAEKNRILQEMATPGPSTSAGRSFMQCDHFEDYDDDIQPKIAKRDDPVHDKYRFYGDLNSELPIAENRTKILTAIRDNKVVVLQGDTGCGKTTQVPQYILDDCFRRREYCNIVCTQPRRIAAISIAQRVCSERKWELGSLVGFQVGLHANVSEDTRLLYCTTGVLLQKLITTKDMSNYTHVLLDEVHERDQDMDFLLIVIKRLLMTNSPNVKVVLMSATIDAKEFSEYFKIGINRAFVPAPIIKVDARRMFNVKDFYLDQLDRLKSSFDINYDEPGISDDMYVVALKMIVVCEKIDYQDQEDVEGAEKPSILIFLPGINEIDRMDKTLLKLKELKTDIRLLPIRLHSMISADEQQKVFRRPPPGHRKVILSTNIAESSITVPDVKYVIDFCLTKSLVTDTSTNLTTLQLHWASRSNCRQRAGRAGRVMHGRVYRLVSKHFYENIMDEYSSPEMLRCPLENIILRAKLLNMGPPHAILALAMSPPNLSDIKNTILVLKEVGALYKTVQGIYDSFDGDLTFVGRLMAGLPVDIQISKLIIFGYMFSVLEEAIIMAAGLNVKSIFDFPFDNGLAAYSQKLTWSDGSGSDLFAILKAYKVWCTMKEQRNFDDEDTEKSWARRYFINTRSMREVHLLVDELKDRLASMGINEVTGVNRVNWLEKEKTIVLKIIISGAFYPNYFLRSGSATIDFQRVVYQSLGGLDPCNTVYLSNFNAKFIGELYVQTIKDLFKEAAIASKNIQIRFGEGSEKIFVTFIHDADMDYSDGNNLTLSVPGRVKPEVYKAIKMRQLRYPTTIRVMYPRDAIEYAELKGVGVMDEGKWVPRKKRIENPELVVIPTMRIHSLRGYITHIENCDKFWFQPLSEQEKLKEIINNLNGPDTDLEPFPNASQISKGMILAAPFVDTKGTRCFYRAKVINLVDRYQQSVSFRVLFIDYGNHEVIDYKKLRKFGRISSRLQNVPPRVFECRLAEVQPSSINCPNGKWPEDAMQLMQTLADKGITEIEIYSVVNGITSVHLKMSEGTFNELLIEKGHAQHSEENYMSKIDHDERSRKQKYCDFYDDDDLMHSEDYLRSIQEEDDLPCEPPPMEKRRSKMHLRGPFSPLESRIFAATSIGHWKSVTVEHQSVNSVLLDTDPQDSRERLLVAATVTENSQNSTLTARSTTLMPNIHGFAPLMGLIFCPTMEIRRDKDKTKYVNILTGLGYDKNGKSLFEEHDIVFTLDVEIVPNDLELINQIRYSMDTLVYTEPGEEKPKILKINKVALAAKIKNLIIRLLEKPRKYIEVHHDSKDHVWGQVDEADLLETTNVYGHRSIFPFHSGYRLYSQPFERTQSLRAHCKELHKLAQHDVTIKHITCKLCDQPFEIIAQLRIHLLSQLHRDREYQIGYHHSTEL